MEKKIITQAEQTTRFNEWLRTQEMPKFKTKIELQRWWIEKCIEHDRMIHLEGYDVIPEFYIDEDTE